MTLDQIKHLDKRLARTSFGNIQFSKDNQVILTIVGSTGYNIQGSPKARFRKEVVASVYVDVHGHVDEIHFHKKSNSKEMRFCVFARLLDQDYIIDDKTESFITWKSYKHIDKHQAVIIKNKVPYKEYDLNKCVLTKENKI
mgnify:CR=1 FL=1